MLTNKWFHFIIIHLHLFQYRPVHDLIARKARDWRLRYLWERGEEIFVSLFDCDFTQILSKRSNTISHFFLFCRGFVDVFLRKAGDKIFDKTKQGKEKLHAGVGKWVKKGGR